MGLIEFYLIFALTTSLIALIDIFIPAVQEAKADGITNVLTENCKTSYLVYFVISAILAPFIFLPVIIPSMHARFKTSLTKTIREE